jgi:predicted nucleic acid binding AN1-type Zn finger protein
MAIHLILASLGRSKTSADVPTDIVRFKNSKIYTYHRNSSRHASFTKLCSTGNLLKSNSEITVTSSHSARDARKNALAASSNSTPFAVMYVLRSISTDVFIVSASSDKNSSKHRPENSPFRKERNIIDAKEARTVITVTLERSPQRPWRPEKYSRNVFLKFSPERGRPVSV